MSNDSTADEWVRQLEPAALEWLRALPDKLSWEARSVAMVLAESMNGALITSLSMRDIARDAGMPRTRYSAHNEATAREALNELVRGSYLERYSRRGYANEYAAVFGRRATFTDADLEWLRANSIAAA